MCQFYCKLLQFYCINCIVTYTLGERRPFTERGRYSYSLLPAPCSLLPTPYFLPPATTQITLISMAVRTAYSGPGTVKPLTMRPQA